MLSNNLTLEDEEDVQRELLALQEDIVSPSTVEQPVSENSFLSRRHRQRCRFKQVSSVAAAHSEGGRTVVV